MNKFFVAIITAVLLIASVFTIEVTIFKLSCNYNQHESEKVLKRAYEYINNVDSEVDNENSLFTRKR